MRSIVIRSSHKFIRNDGFSFKFFKNALVILKKKMNVFGREVIGPSSLEMRIKKFRKSIIYIY